MGLMEKFANPDLITSLGFGEKMAGSAVTTLMGMGITFIVLFILWGFISAMGKAMTIGKKGDKAQSHADADATPSDAAAKVEVPVQAASDDALIAVIAAAIAAYEGDGTAGHLVVKKIRRVSGEVTPWSNAAREDCIDSRRF